MTRATHVFHNRIVLVFDFDRTLGQDSADEVIKFLDGAPSEMREEFINPLHSSWDDNLARLFGILQFAKSQNKRLTRDDLVTVGKNLPLYESVDTMPERLRQVAKEVVNDIEVEFRILSGGFTDIINATPIAGQYAAIYGYQLYFAEDGDVLWPRRVITHPEKIRYLLAISKGLSKESGAAPRDVYRSVDDANLHAPFDQMIYVGDGASDLPAFEFLNGRGGISLGIVEPGNDPGDWKHEDEVRHGQRVQNLAPADYAAGSPLFDSLTLAVRSVANLIAIRKRSQDK